MIFSFSALDGTPPGGLQGDVLLSSTLCRNADIHRNMKAQSLWQAHRDRGLQVWACW
jgi:hypothetical protein